MSEAKSSFSRANHNGANGFDFASVVVKSNAKKMELTVFNAKAWLSISKSRFRRANQKPDRIIANHLPETKYLDFHEDSCFFGRIVFNKFWNGLEEVFIVLQNPTQFSIKSE